MSGSLWQFEENQNCSRECCATHAVFGQKIAKISKVSAIWLASSARMGGFLEGDCYQNAETRRLRTSGERCIRFWVATALDVARENS